MSMHLQNIQKNPVVFTQYNPERVISQTKLILALNSRGVLNRLFRLYQRRSRVEIDNIRLLFIFYFYSINLFKSLASRMF